LHLEFKS